MTTPTNIQGVGLTPDNQIPTASVERWRFAAIESRDPCSTRFCANTGGISADREPILPHFDNGQKRALRRDSFESLHLMRGNGRRATVRGPAPEASARSWKVCPSP